MSIMLKILIILSMSVFYDFYISVEVKIDLLRIKIKAYRVFRKPLIRLILSVV